LYRGDLILPRALARLLQLLLLLLWRWRAQCHEIRGSSIGCSIKVHSPHQTLQKKSERGNNDEIN
jgi:hypothetical protein